MGEHGMGRRWGKALSGVLVGMVLGVSAVQAAEFVVDFDSQRFNADFDGISGLGFNLGWRGTARIDVTPESCVSPSSTVNFTTAPCLGAATFLRFDLVFYDATASGAPAVLSISGSGPGLPDPDFVSFDGSGVASGMDLAAPIQSLGSAGLGTYFWDWELDFTLSPFNGPTLKLTYDAGGGGCPTVGNNPQCVFTSATTGGNVPSVTWTGEGNHAVPEPGTLALLGLGLAGLAATRRRKQ